MEKIGRIAVVKHFLHIVFARHSECFSDYRNNAGYKISGTHRHPFCGNQIFDGRIENAVTGRLCGAGIRVYKGLGSVYAYTNDTSYNGLMACARKAAQAVGEGACERQVRLGGSVAANS